MGCRSSLKMAPACSYSYLPFAPSARHHHCSPAAINLHPHHAAHGFKQGFSLYTKIHNTVLISSPIKTKILCSMDLTADQSNEPGRTNFDNILKNAKILWFDKILKNAKTLWDNSPQPVKDFPWDRTLENFIQLILDLVLAVFKYLSVPVLVVTSVSEMSYCAHERKLRLIGFPILLGVVVARVLTEAALESSPSLKDAEVPWHLVAMAVFFAVLKLPGPYYPYWGRIMIPHFANGGLFTNLWFAFLWYNKKKDNNIDTHQTSL